MLRFVTQLIDLRFNILSVMKEKKTLTYKELLEELQKGHPSTLTWPNITQLVEAVNELAARQLLEVEGLRIGTYYRIDNPKELGVLSDLKISF